MFVLQSTYDKVVRERNHEARGVIHWQIKHTELMSRWNQLVQRINDKGGEDFLLYGKIDKTVAKTVHQFTDDELRSLLQLVHPDKHGGKQSAVVLTQKINALRKR